MDHSPLKRWSPSRLIIHIEKKVPAEVSPGDQCEKGHCINALFQPYVELQKRESIPVFYIQKTTVVEENCH